MISHLTHMRMIIKGSSTPSCWIKKTDKTNLTQLTQLTQLT